MSASTLVTFETWVAYAYKRRCEVSNEEIIERLKAWAGLKCQYQIKRAGAPEQKIGVLLGYRLTQSGHVLARLSAQFPPEYSPEAGCDSVELVAGANDYNCFSDVDPAKVSPLETAPSWRPTDWIFPDQPVARATVVTAGTGACRCGWPHGPCAACTVDVTP